MINPEAGSGREGGSLLGLVPTSSPPPHGSWSISKACGVSRCPQISFHPGASSKSH